LKIWKNGQFLPESEAKASIYDSSLMFGDMAFEMLRTFNKKPFKLYEHIRRLLYSCKYLEIDIPYSAMELEAAFQSLLIENRNSFAPDDEIRGLINVSRGTLEIYKDILPMGTWVTMTCFPLRWVIKGAYRFYQDGVNAVIPSQRAIPAYLLDPKVKNRSRMHYQMANMEAARVDPKSWALLLDVEGHLAEGSGSNFFIIKNRELFTPEPRNILRGISRDYVMRLAKRLKIEVFERNLNAYDVYTADEAFFTCTPYSIMPCTRINGSMIGGGKVGRLTKYLQHKWSEDVNCFFVDQSRKWDA